MTAFLSKLESRLDSWDPRPVYAAVFGSAAYGGMRTGSDIDLLLVRPDGVDDDVWDDQAQTLTAEMTRWTGNDTRAIVLDENDVGPGEPVLQDVLAHGLTVGGSRAWLVKRTRPAQVDA